MKALILLHEIYGINKFIDLQRKKFEKLGFKVYCPDFYNGTVFNYTETETAYTYFYKNIGLNAYFSIWNLVNKLKLKHEAVYIIGYSVGATLAWRCCENPNCTEIISFYGSRIRDYLNVIPKCPVLLLFAENDSFDVASVIKVLKNIPHTNIASFQAEHGFFDPYSAHYNAIQTKKAEDKVLSFLNSAHLSNKSAQ